MVCRCERFILAHEQRLKWTSDPLCVAPEPGDDREGACLAGCTHSKSKQNGTYKDIRSQAIDLFARGRSGREVGNVEERIARHSVLAGVEAPGRSTEEAWGDGAVAEGVV